jgi:SH3-like domain-containing protein
VRFQIVNTDGQGVNMRPTPDTSSAPVAVLAENAAVNGDEHAWRRVTDAATNPAYIANEFLTALPNGFVVANTDGQGVNLRAQPDSSATRLSALAEGARVTAEQHAWRHVFDGAGNQGWVADDYLVCIDADLWTFDMGLACGRENYWDPDGQPNRQAAMVRFNQVAYDRRLAIFEAAMTAGLDAESVVDPTVRDQWKRAMRSISLGDGFPGECPDLNPFMLAGEVGGVYRGGADRLNSSALGYFQFLSQHPIPIGTSFSPEFDYGHWSAFGPCQDYAHQTEPTSQVREFIRAIRASAKHQGDPMSVVQEKATPPHVWGP